MRVGKNLWQPGQSGNPRGRPSIKGEVETLARTHTTEVLETLVDLMRNGSPDAVRVAAANALLPQVLELFKTEDAREGVQSFIERRAGNFTGR